MTDTAGEFTLPPQIIDVHNHLGETDTDGDQLVEIMDKSGVQATLVMGTSYETNVAHIRAHKKHPGRMIPGVFADPRDGQKAVDAIQAGYDQGVRIVKLFPNCGYFPDDPAFSFFFDFIAERKMAVLSHCGFLWYTFGVTAAYHSNPGRFEKLMRHYSETPFILAHMGGIDGFLQMIMLTTRLKNAYVDCSPGQGTWVLEFANQMAASVPPQKLMWGADGYGQTEYLARTKPLLEKAGFGPHLAKIHYENAAGIFKSIGAM